MDSDTCYCDEDYPVVLQFQFSDSAIVCSNCNLNARVEPPSNSVARDIELWNDKYKIAYNNWLESEDYIDDIENVGSSLNLLGFSIVKRLNKYQKVYYWWHTFFETVDDCPKCNAPLVKVKNDYNSPHKVCETCSILLNDNVIVH